MNTSRRWEDDQEKLTSLETEVSAAVQNIENTFPDYVHDHIQDTSLLQRLLGLREADLARYQYKTQRITYSEIRGYNVDTFHTMMEEFGLEAGPYAPFGVEKLYNVFIEGLIRATQFQIDVLRRALDSTDEGAVDTLRQHVSSETRETGERNSFPAGTTVVVGGQVITGAHQIPEGVTISGVRGTGSSSSSNRGKFEQLERLETIDRRSDEPLEDGEEKIDDMEAMRRMQAVASKKKTAIAEAERAFGAGEIDEAEKRQRVSEAKMTAMSEMVEIDRLLED